MKAAGDSTSAGTARLDRFGNRIDPDVGYARGELLRSSYEETLRLAHGRQLLRARLEKFGMDSTHIYTGNQRDLPIRVDDLTRLCEEWVGPSVFWPQLEACIVEHLGGKDSWSVAVFNRTSAGIIAALSALTSGGITISMAAKAGASHVSVARGARIAGSLLLQVSDLDSLRDALARPEAQLLVLTSFSSDLDALEVEALRSATAAAHERGVPVFLDDAYGARLRPAVQHGPPALGLGVDIAISNSDKAGLRGPRAGFMAGRPDFVGRVAARAAELGQEARAPIAVGVLRSLESFTPATVQEEIEDGRALISALSARLGGDVVGETALGPLMSEDDVLQIALARAGRDEQPPVTPAEASAALGMFLLRDYGIVTVNVLGAPGSRVSLRLKPIPDALERCGGPEAVADAVSDAIDQLAMIVFDTEALRSLLLGDL